MKTMIAVMLLVVSGVASAGASLCPVYEFAELNTFSDKELGDKWGAFFGRGTRVAADDIGRGDRGSVEFQNCMDQANRISRIQNARYAEKLSKMTDAERAAEKKRQDDARAKNP